MTEDKKELRAGSARARLEAFEREQKGKKSIFFKLGIVFVLLVVVLVMQYFMSSMEKDHSWMKAPKDIAYLVREGRWEDFRLRLHDEFEITGRPGLNADALTELIKSYGKEGVSVYATAPFDFKEAEGQARINFWVTWSRGDIDNPGVVPLVQTWLVQALMVKDDGVWKARSLVVRDTISASGAPDLETLLDK